jgi:hypothetical protein
MERWSFGPPDQLDVVGVPKGRLQTGKRDLAQFYYDYVT